MEAVFLSGSHLIDHDALVLMLVIVLDSERRRS